jgi:hypothetical protein
MTSRENPNLASEKVSTKHNLYRLLAYMPRRMFEALLDVARGNVQEGLSWEDFAGRYHLETYDYIEVHYHGEVNIHRDLERVVVSHAEADSDTKAKQVYDMYIMAGKTPLVRVP